MNKDNHSTDSVRDHYNNLLGPIYSWIIGDFETAYKKSVELFSLLDIKSCQGALAVDLGCGSGCQAVALADAGFQVTAVDFCDDLLAELQRHAGDRPIRTVNDDILHFAHHVSDAPDLIVCMGDTLVHLPNERSVHDLLALVAERLVPGGTFVATLRDYSGPAPNGPDRFIPVRSSPDRIFTCFLEFRGKTIDVHDILHTRENGEWRLDVSRYTKLRLDYNDVVESLRSEGLRVDDVLDHHGMKVIRARKPS